MGAGTKLASVLLTGAAACSTNDQPLTATELRALPGWIYFHSAEELPRVYRVRASGEELSALTPEGVPAFVYGEHHGRLALTVADEIVIARPDGRNPRVVARAEGVAWHPRWSPRGDRLLFESSRSSFRDLYAVEIAGDRVQRLTDDAEGNFDGSWSPDGRRIALASSRSGQLALWVMNADGSDAEPWTEHAGDSVKPEWSPTGDAIAFISARDGRDDLYLIRGRGLLPEKLSAPLDGRGFVERYAWSPDGRAISFAWREGKRSRLHVVELPEGAVRAVSGDAHDDADPSWSPDGRWLVFSSKVEGVLRLVITGADGRRRTTLPLTQEGGPSGAWLPRWLAPAEGEGT